MATTSRAAIRSFRTLRTTRTPLRTVRRPYSSTTEQATQSVSPAIVGGFVGGGIVLAAGYGYYHFSGVKTTVNTASQVKAYFDKGTQKLQNASPEPNEAIHWMREMAVSYAAVIPGAKGYVNKIFDDVDKIHDKHGDKVDSAIKEAYENLKKVTKDKGLSLETAQKTGDIVEHLFNQLSSLAGDAVSDIMENHPELKKQIGGNVDQLKSMGNKYGPEAKKQVDETWSQIADVFKSGVSAESINKARKIVQEKMEVLKKMDDETWQKGLEQAQPYLSKSPQIKKLIEENSDALKQGNMSELWEKVKDATQSGNMDSLKSFVNSAKDKAKDMGSSAGGDMEKYFGMIPGADQVWPKIMQLKEVGDKHGKEAEDLLKETFKEVQDVLSKKLGEADKLAKDAKKDSES